MNSAPAHRRTHDGLDTAVDPLAPKMPLMVPENLMNNHLRMLMAGAALSLIAAGASPAMAMPGGQATAHDHAAAPPAQAAPVDPAARPRTDTMMRAMAIDEEITALTDQMNKATGQARIDAMTRLLTTLVQHRSMMMQEMKMMQDDLDAEHEAMQHMRQMMGRGMSNTPPADVKK
jgi:hypothetical protein